MANLEYFNTHCCAMEEIHNLESFDGDPKGAMISFCKSNLGKPIEWKIRLKSGDYGNDGALYSFYFFTAAVYGRRENYGSQFAKFIEEAKLGTIVTTPVMTNMAFHTDHGNQVWIWMPNLKSLKAWWEVNKPVSVPKKRSTF